MDTFCLTKFEAVVDFEKSFVIIAEHGLTILFFKKYRSLQELEIELEYITMEKEEKEGKCQRRSSEDVQN